MVSYDIDRVKIYNFMQMNKLTQAELSKMLGRCPAYISSIMGKRARVSEKTLEDLATLMEVKEEDLIAKPDTAFSEAIVKNDFDPVLRKKFEEMVSPDSDSNEEISLTEYARRRGITVQAVYQTFKRHKSELEGTFRRRGKITAINKEGVDRLDKIRNAPRNAHLRDQSSMQAELLAMSARGSSDRRMTELADLLCRAFVNGQKTIKTVDLMRIMIA